ncbi:MAG TPA: hypothetical protein VHP99_00100, partial [Pyrinomonadaceae bacterium]|jgi:tetratricopeptide (TPR) repeat protein|nr:hypothetical protein [Pyrinomonadaceae bacterium]
MVEGCRQAVERAVAPHDMPPGNKTMGSMVMSPNMLVESYADMRANFIIDGQLWNDDVVRSTLPAGDYSMAQLTFDYTNALAAIRRGDLAGARAAISKAESDRQRALPKGTEQRYSDPRREQRLAILTEQLRALLAGAEGKGEEAVTELKRIAAKEDSMSVEFGPPAIYKPTNELLGDLLLELHRSAEARDAFQLALGRAPGRRSVLQALARGDNKTMVAK